MTEPDSEDSHKTDPLFTCWTTVSTEAEGLAIANAFVNERIAACVQLDGPTTSIYNWDGERCSTTEFRLWLKILGSNLPIARTRINELHPYHTHQWIETEAVKVDEKYLIWIKKASTVRLLGKKDPS
tara:strand:- start:628 stop:1008 length:381 start_codon:yes stop_codon:yes gene_type:complete